MKRLIIDCQILQTAAFDRGMGKYTLSLLKEFCAKQKKYQVIELLLNKNLDHSKKRISSITDYLTANIIVRLDIPTDISTNVKRKYKLAEEEISNYIDKTNSAYSQTDFLITSPFFVDFPAVFPAQPGVHKFSVVYDIIPQKIWHLLRIFPDNIYFNHFKIFFQADKLFTISKAVRDDLVSLVGVDSKKIESIDGGPFKKIKKGEQKKLELKQPYIIYPSAPIIHKNNERAVSAFERFNRAHDNKYTLYITSTFNDESRKKLTGLSAKVRFTGNIEDEELAYAYAHTSALYFPSLSEGLGMPVLEAVQYGVPVVCSSIPVLSEISEQAFYQFDPTDEVAMASSLGQAISKDDWKTKSLEYPKIEQEYSWESSAQKLINGLQKATIVKHNQTPLIIKIPNPNNDSPAAELGEKLYAQASSNHDVRVVFGRKGKINRPSFVSYIDYPKINGSTIEIRNKGILGAKKVELRYKKRRVTVYARRFFRDNALQLKGWEFVDRESKILSPSKILNDLMSV